MNFEGKYIWIWELNRCDNGDVAKLIQDAHNTNIDGYIIKTHDGSNFWYQAHAIQEFKNAGLTIGAWGYCYGKNANGEVAAIKQTVTFKPDFYVMDVEMEFEASNMSNVASQMLSQLTDIGIPLGYTSFAIPSYHKVPFDVFSAHCQFTMPQIYWAEMKMDVTKAFETSIREYSKYNIPIYPIGQITSDVASADIIQFNNLCYQQKIPLVSYWDCQSASIVQLDAIKESVTQEFTDSVNVLKNNGIINDVQYWIQNAAQGKTVDGEYARILITRIANKLKS